MRWWEKEIQKKVGAACHQWVTWHMDMALVTTCRGRSAEGQCGTHGAGEKSLLSSCGGHPRRSLWGSPQQHMGAPVWSLALDVEGGRAASRRGYVQ